MKTLEELGRRIRSVEDMRSVVSTMKSLAAARIRQFETAAAATRAYGNTVELALQVLLRDPPQVVEAPFYHSKSAAAGVILIGSDQGFCGRFNETIFQAANESFGIGEQTGRPTSPLILTIGSRLSQLVSRNHVKLHRSIHIPKTVSEITDVIQQIIPQLEIWQRELGVGQVDLFYNLRQSASSYAVKQTQLMPLSNKLIDQLGNSDWQSRSLPIYHLSWPAMFIEVIRQYLFLYLFRAFAESLAAENASRIAAMHQAEKNIDRRLNELHQQFNENRQREITEELLDIISGFEAVTGTGKIADQ